MNIDIADVRRKAKQQWVSERRRALTIQELAELLLPWLLVCVAVTFFALSAPHTIAVFSLLTPGFGALAPLGVEAGILYVSFRRHQLLHADKKVPAMINVLLVFSAVISVIVNGAGSLDAVVSALGLSAESFDKLMADYVTLPVVSQAALILVAIAALIIPLGTFVAGDGLAGLLLDRREHGDTLENEWTLVRADVEYAALLDAAVGAGMKPIEARRFANGLVKSVRTRSDTSGQRGQADGQQMTETEKKIIDAVTADPTLLELDYRALGLKLGVGKTTVGDTLNKYGFSRNGKTPDGTSIH